MSDSIQHYSQAAWMAKVAIEAEEIGSPRLPEHVALPGAKQAVPQDRLLAYQDAGLGEHEIVGRVNARYRQENAVRLDAHARWVQGPYANAIEEMARRDAEAKAQALRERALFQELIREREEG
jgi:hypothetical protein